MNKVLMRELFNKHMRIDITYPGYQKEKTASVIRHVSLTSEPGFVIFSELDDVHADAVIDEQITYFRKLKQPFEWKVFDYDQPLDLKEKLRAKGFTIEEPEALMLFDLIEGDSLQKIPVRSEIKHITTEQGIWDIVRLEDEVWGDSHQELGERLIRDLHNDIEELFVYAAYVDGKAVSAAWMYLHEDTPFASLWGGSTLPEYRKKGYYISLLGIRALEAAARGYQILMVDASSMSQPILEKHGFKCHALSTPCMSPTYESE
jgi:GNAT superfamily N-acetyltransferase